MKNRFVPRIVILCGSLVRDYGYQRYLKKVLKKNFTCEVIIIGSLAEGEQMFGMLFKIQPHIVILPQVLEQICRNLAGYIKASGGIVCILPSEITYSTVDDIGLINKRISYNQYVDYFFLPGKQTMKDILRNTDISKNKLHVTGHPKIDLLLNEKVSRKNIEQIIKQYHIDKTKKIIGVFTSFITTPLEYVNQDVGYTGISKLVEKRNYITEQTQMQFVKDMDEVCQFFPEYQFILKIHPLEEEISIYEKMQSKNIILIQKESLQPILHLIDLGIHLNSTVSTECWILHIPTIQYVPNKKMLFYLSDFKQGNPVVLSRKILIRYIKKYMTSSMEKKYLRKQKDYINNWYYKADGKSTKRILKYIRSIGENAVNDTDLHYNKVTSYFYDLFIVLEKMIGLYYSRRVVSLFRKDYVWKYGIDNYVFDE